MLKKILITGLGTGYLPVAPGTWGSAGAAIVYVLAVLLTGGAAWPVNLVLAGIVLVFSIICVALGGFAEQVFGKKDPGQATADEWAGQALTYILLPLPRPHDLLGLAIVAGTGFILFRVMDIVKPPPANQIQALPKGWGILLDDLVAGVYANIAAQLILRLALKM